MLIGSKRPAGSGACVWPAALIVWGKGSVSTGHAHHCIQLMLALTGALRVRERARARWRRCGAVLVRPDVRHEIDARGASVLIGFLDAESDLGASVAQRIRSPLDVISNREVSQWRRALGDPAALDSTRVRKWIASALARERSSARIHPRVRHVLRVLRDYPLDARSTSLDRLAGMAKLSPSRFAHVFTESVGVPVRPYLMWLRLQRAAAALVSGRSATQAAYIAGFSDGAHLSRTFRRMMGVSPRELHRSAAVTRELRVDAE